MSTYAPREELKPRGLDGISDAMIEDHWTLYKGYVTQTNTLREELAKLRQESKTDSLVYADRRRRYGFEYNGMVLHEYYFGNMKPQGGPLPGDGKFVEAIKQQFGSTDAWKADFIAAGKSRSIGWAITYFDPAAKVIENHFVQLHEEGNVAGFAPLFVMDVWEHAYTADFRATGRPAYIEAFFKNVNWGVVESRYKAALEGKIANRFGG
jgi:Fe-Mn family superoxide dismutase